MSGKQSTGKPFTAAFEQQTKIRMIIQEVLAATNRKLSQFNDKVETFEEFFFTFKQRVADIEERSRNNESQLERMSEKAIKDRSEISSELIRLEQKQQKLRIQNNETVEEVKEVNKKINNITRQNQSMSTQFSKTKSKFIEFSEQITTLKEEVSWKITKYVEETAQTNTQIKISNEEIKKEYFNVNLALQSNKERYDQIISMRDQQENLNQKVEEAIESLEKKVEEKSQNIKQLNSKLEEMDTALYAKIKQSELKLEKKIDELFESNKKIQQSVAKVDNFSVLLNEIRDDSEKTRRQLLKKFEESDLKHKSLLDQQILNLNKTILANQKAADKKIRALTESQQKTVDFFNQKMEYLKVEIETELSSKATRMLEQKSKTQSGATSSALVELQERISKISLQTTKSVNKVENMVKEIKLEVKNQIEDMKDSVETKITSTIRSIEQSSGSGVSPEFVQSINEKIQKIADSAEIKLFEMSKELAEQNLKILQVQRMKEETTEIFKQMRESNEEKFNQFESKLNNKVEKVMFLVTKMRGDAIIRNEFTDKQIKQLKKSDKESRLDIDTILKLLPATGECVNLILSLIFDAEYQHSKIIQDQLPNLSKDTIKFQNILEGVLYEYIEKKKPGTICYRHKQLKKTDIVKTTFNAYIQVWEQLFNNDLKHRHEFIPRSFYKKCVEKYVGKTPRTGASPSRQPNEKSKQNLSYHTNKEISLSKEFISDDSRNLVGPPNIDTSQNMNRSFHIRKKKNALVKSKDDIIMVVSEDIAEQK